MPFTPLHMGPGVAIKALAGKHFSLVSFGLAQIAIDLEPLAAIVFGATKSHSILHNYLAAVIIAIIVIVVAPPIGRLILRLWQHQLSFYGLSWLDPSEPTLSLMPTIVGAFTGTLSHVTIDSITHSVMTPLAPWSNYNGLLEIISISAVHQWCIWLGLLGISAWIVMAWYNRTASWACGHPARNPGAAPLNPPLIRLVWRVWPVWPVGLDLAL